MKSARWSLAAAFLALGVSVASAEPEDKTFGASTAKAEQKYRRQRKELGERGKAAMTAAEGRDFVAWKEAHAAYMESLLNLTMLCESAVSDLSKSTSDYATTGARPILGEVSHYVDVAGTFLKQRLLLMAFANLIERSDPSATRPLLDALVHVYFAGD